MHDATTSSPPRQDPPADDVAPRNGDSPFVDGQRNVPLTAAERQRRYRDRKRGGPAKGRWAGHVSAKVFASQWAISRSTLFMSQRIRKLSPDLTKEVEGGRMRVGRAYRILRLAIRMEAEEAT